MHTRYIVFLDKPVSELSDFKLFLQEVLNKVFSNTSYKPKNCERIKVDIKVIYDPRTKKEEFHENIMEFPYDANEFSVFKTNIGKDMEKILKADNIPDNCKRIAVKATIIFNPKSNHDESEIF